MKRIIVVGYPKSGCTWVTRLVADLVGCPVAGFWGSEKKEIATEGLERRSDFRCYKSHHQLGELGVDPRDRETSIIYVLRDPRDIAISASNFFVFYRGLTSRRFLEEQPRWLKAYRRTLYPLFVRRNYRLARMTNALLRGDAGVHNWCRVSWLQHLQPYRDAGLQMVRYEDLLAQPEAEAAKILERLGVERSRDEVKNAVARQSFAGRKEAFLRAGETGQAKFLRVGKSGQWRTELPADLCAPFEEELGAELAACGYPSKCAEQSFTR